MNVFEAIRHPLLQVFFSALISCAGTYFFAVNGPRTLAHAIWLFAIPAIIGIVSNEGRARQAIMAFLLMLVSAASSIALMLAVWGGY